MLEKKISFEKLVFFWLMVTHRIGLIFSHAILLNKNLCGQLQSRCILYEDLGKSISPVRQRCQPSALHCASKVENVGDTDLYPNDSIIYGRRDLSAGIALNNHPAKVSIIENLRRNWC